jgi:hypothetical protein
VKEPDAFIKAYHEFKERVDLTLGGTLPEIDDLVCNMLLGIPHVPADQDNRADAPMAAIDQRISILKVLFVEANRDRPDDFLDEGLRRYDLACAMAKMILQEEERKPDKRQS